MDELIYMLLFVRLSPNNQGSDVSEKRRNRIRSTEEEFCLSAYMKHRFCHYLSRDQRWICSCLISGPVYSCPVHKSWLLQYYYNTTLDEVACLNFTRRGQKVTCVCVWVCVTALQTQKSVLPDVAGRVLVLVLVVGFGLGMAEQHILPEGPSLAWIIPGERS